MKKNIPLYCFTIIIGAFLVLAFLLNFTLAIDPLKSLDDEDTTFKDFTGSVQKQYTSEFSMRNGFINLNGFFTKMVGKKTNNNVDKLKNNMLINSNIVKVDMSSLSSNINKLNAHLNDNGVKFLYVQLPMKMDKNNSLLRNGYVNFANENANNLLGGLDDSVSYIDMRDYIASTPEQVEKYFYNTDHHWNAYGAFEAYGVILNYLKEEITKLALELPRHKVTPYENIGKKNYSWSKEE